MKIQLQQSEIEAAILLYMGSQGLNLVNKTFDISFTATRKAETGIIADLEIVDIPAAGAPTKVAKVVIEADPVTTDKQPAAAVKVAEKQASVGAAVRGASKTPTTAAEAIAEANTLAAQAKEETKQPSQSDTEVLPAAAADSEAGVGTESAVAEVAAAGEPEKKSIKSLFG